MRRYESHTALKLFQETFYKALHRNNIFDWGRSEVPVTVFTTLAHGHIILYKKGNTSVNVSYPISRRISCLVLGDFDDNAHSGVFKNLKGGGLHFRCTFSKAFKN